MIPIPVFWTKHTATLNGRVLKLVPCENCSTEYVYVLEREGSGVGTSVYMLNEEGAASHAQSAAEDTLQAYLENDFDPVPCPACGHYQRYMFPKLLETKSLRGPAMMLVLLLVGCLAAVSALYWSVVYLQRPNDRVLERMVITWSTLLIVGLVGLGLWLIKQARIRRFDPNVEDQQARIAKGRSRAVTRTEFEVAQSRYARLGFLGVAACARQVHHKNQSGQQ
jgi:Zn ribbon nucleic-acid-binding protein